MDAYKIQANEFATKVGLTMTIGKPIYKDHFNDGVQRWVFPITLKRNGEVYKLKYGQSIANGSNKPTLYDILACVQKYDVGSFDDFCGEFGYDMLPLSQYKSMIKIYNNVCKEYEGIERLFSDVMDVLCEIR